MPLLIIASLTLREAIRRRVVLVAAIAGLVVIVASGWGLGKLAASMPSHVAALGLTSVLTIFLAFVMSVVLAAGAAFLAAPAIAGDVESGVALAILPRPIARAEFVLGKWLGLLVLLAVYATVFGAIELLVIAVMTGYQAPHPFFALGYLIAQSSVMVSFALLLSTRLPPVAAGFLTIVCFGVAWIAGIAAGIAAAIHNTTVLHVATAVGLCFPSDGLWRGALYSLQPVVLLVGTQAAGGPPNPFGTNSAPSLAFALWAALWVVAMLEIAVVSFVRRDL